MVERGVASEDIKRWLDYKKVSERKRESYKENVELLIDAVEDGQLVVNEDCTIDYTLYFPFGEEIKVEQLTFKPRLKVANVKSYLKNVKPSDADGRLTAYMCALTGKATAIINSLDTEDYGICQAIAVFFV